MNPCVSLFGSDHCRLDTLHVGTHEGMHQRWYADLDFGPMERSAIQRRMLVLIETMSALELK